MDYASAEAFILNALPMFQRLGGAALKKVDLSKTIGLLQYLDNPHLQFKSIHIAGTNGKGSVAHMLSAVFQAHGLKVGLFTSPHLKDYRERIKINGKYIDKQFVLHWIQKHYNYLQENRLSFFEMSTGLAFDYYSHSRCDIAIIETGLGGRLDSTNVIQPLLSIITNIGFDHTQFLGTTLEQIAGEKAGIIKPKTPVLLGNVDRDLISVFETKANKESAKLYLSEEHLIRFEWLENFKRKYTVHIPGWDIDTLSIDNPAPYQDFNLNTTLHALLILKNHVNFSIQPHIVKNGLEQFSFLSKFRGRFEILNQSPLIVADATHNTAGIAYLKGYFDKKNIHLHIVLGMVSDKDHESFLKLLPHSAKYYFCSPNVPRGLEAEKLKVLANKEGLKGEVWPDVNKVLNHLKLTGTEKDIVLVFGSIFLIAEIL